ncbi:N-acetylmuramoyl-L-alanine amidase [Neobacillus pocheonensis]|uniref:N-acetylmuramoyl-L-alanine amidase n=1 Tax=Neobacillus pocheonensis TaxID=363869 RepID=A0ABT0WHV5_9BACI|nr:N-acetylmuramoyl-L-alanine amidase [Neobacillus pocheonensis]
MNKKIVATIAMVGILMLLHVKILAYASTVLGPIGIIDTPMNNSLVKGQSLVHGWFLDKTGVSKVEVLVDNAVAGQATYGDARSDVQKAYPQYDNGKAGYHYTLDTTKFSDGIHTVSIRETGANNHVTILPKTTITIANVKGYVDNPVSGTTLTGTKNVSGWFLDQSGVQKIEVLVDGAVAGQATYGDARSDVQKIFPEYNNGNAGYHFALDTTKFSDGIHTVSIRETGANNHVTSLPKTTITIANVKGYVDNPVSGAKLKGTKNVSGWFLDQSGVQKIEIVVDSAVAGQATYGDARTDVQKAFPEYNNGNAGFHYALDTTKFSAGKHTISIRETGMNGSVTTLPGSTITIANAEGYVDNPVSGATFKGTQNVSGWFLDESGVQKIEIVVDSAVAGQATYGDVRTDVQKAFPEYNNGNAGFHYALDTTKFSVGKHTISIRETGMNGSVTTLPEITVSFKQPFTVFLDPGHGGSDSGATAGGYRESDLNLAVAKKVQALLVDRGYTVYMSRNDDTFVSLLDRSQMANNLHADIFLSIHHNSSGSPDTSPNGVESYYYQYDPNYPSKINAGMDTNPERISKSVTLANLIHKNLVAYTGAIDRGTSGETFSVVRESAMPATLQELGYITNPSERQKLITDSYQNTEAKAIADGIDMYFETY